MIEVECGVKAFDVHELLCHYVARDLGYYEEEGLRVSVRDRTFTPDEALPQTSYFQVACGAAFLGRRAGHPFKVVFAACTRPMFWLYGAAGVEQVEELAGGRIGAHPAVAPPHLFARLTLRNHGLDPDRDVSFEPVRDDAARLGMLAAGELRGAVASSAVSPLAVERRGLRPLALLGDHVRFTTTGIGLFERMLDEQPEVAAALVRCSARALEVIRREPDRAAPIAAVLLGEDEATARRTLDLALPCFTADGRVDHGELQGWIDALEVELPGDAHVDARDLYDFSLVP